MYFHITIYTVLTLLLGFFSIVLTHGFSVLAGLLGGMAAGAPLGFYGLHLTRFETTDKGFFYTPNPYMGLGLSMLFVARLAYRIIVLSSASAQSTAPEIMQSPLTMCIYGLLAGYYVVYFIGVLMRSRENQPAVI
jgi:hypothetical protein